MLCAGVIVDPDSGQPVSGPAGGPLTKSFMVPRDAIEIFDTWRAHGMRATGSHDFGVTNRFVPDPYAFDGMLAAAVEPGPLYAIPIMVQAPLPHMALAIGIARAALADLIDLAGRKTPLLSRGLLRERETVQHAIGLADVTIRAAHALMHATVTQLWEAVARGQPPSPPAAGGVMQVAAYVTRTCVDSVTALYHAAGGSAVWESHPLQRRFRDIHVAAAHFLVNDDKITQAGKGLLGGAPGPA
jgi:alkylation response protein AidB-like acyl-CoA dehydrogenase